MLLAVTAFFAACSDDDASWNTNADVTVEMGKTEVKVKEGAGLFNVPIVVKGETTAPVRVHVSMRESGSNPAKKDVNYMVTDTTIVISDGAGKVEVKTVDDDEINENRTFEVYIVSADGAKVGANSSTNVVLRDNDSEFYEKLQGVWKMKCVDTKGAAKEWSMTGQRPCSSMTTTRLPNRAHWHSTNWVLTSLPTVSTSVLATPPTTYASTRAHHRVLPPSLSMVPGVQTSRLSPSIPTRSWLVPSSVLMEHSCALHGSRLRASP